MPYITVYSAIRNLQQQKQQQRQQRQQRHHHHHLLCRFMCCNQLPLLIWSLREE